MSMTSEEQEHLEREIKRYFPEPKLDADLADYKDRKKWEVYQDQLRERVWAAYTATKGAPMDWVLVEFMDAETMTIKLYWRKKT